MLIRREDKEFIQSLSLLGALLGTCIGFYMVMHLSDRAHKVNARQSEYQQTQAALLKLSTDTVTPNNPIASKEVLDQVQQQMENNPVQATADTKSFWLTVPRWGLWSLCGIGGLAGAITGYTAIWLTGWAGSLFIYQFIRFLYTIMRKTAPNCQAVQGTNVLYPDAEGSFKYERNEKRFLPTVVKLFFFLLLSLALLTLVVWRLTSL